MVQSAQSRETLSAAIPAAEQPGVRLDALTGLRWFAAFAVFLSHVSTLLPMPNRGLDSLMAIGSSGVTFFFVLSGFVLTWTFRETDRAGAFWGRRFARIWPMLLVGVLVPYFLQRSDAPQPMRDTMMWAAVSAIFVYQAWVPSHILGSASPVTWSLACEAFFYALFPFLVRPVVRRSLRWLGIAAVLLVVVGWALRIWLWQEYPPTARPNFNGMDGLIFGTYSPIARLWEFLLGVVAAAAIRKGWRSPVNTTIATLLLAAGVFVLWLLRGENFRVGVPFDVLSQVMAPLYAILVVAVATRELNGRGSWLGARPLVKLGQWSYAFYLLQFTVLFEIARRVYDKDSIIAFYMRPAAGSWDNVWWALLAAGIVVVASAVLYQLYERPVELWLRARIGRRPGAAVK